MLAPSIVTQASGILFPRSPGHLEQSLVDIVQGEERPAITRLRMILVLRSVLTSTPPVNNVQKQAERLDVWQGAPICTAPHRHVCPQTCLLVSPSPSFPACSWLVVLVLVAAPLLYWSAFAICAPTAYHHITLYVLHQAHRSFLNITTTMLAPPQLPHRTRTGLRPTDCLHHAAHSLNTMAYTLVAQATLKVPQRSGSVHGCIKKTPVQARHVCR